MILVEAGRRDLRGLDAQLTFAAQLAARGHCVALDAAGLPGALDRGRTYEAAPFLVDSEDLSVEALFLLGAEDIEEAALAALRNRALADAVPVVAIGRFEDHQGYLGARARIAYALGREPRMFDLSESQPRPLVARAATPLVAELAPRPRPLGAVPVLTVALGAKALDKGDVLGCFAAMSHRAGVRLRIIANAKQKERVKASRHHDLPVVTFTDLSPVTLAARTDVFAVYGQGVPGERMAALSVCLLGAGGVVVDCTEDGAFLALGAPALRGPVDPAALEAYLTDTVLVNLGPIGAQLAASPWIAGADIARLEAAAGLASGSAAPARGRAARARGRTVFMPTNGVGLGHAQRCSVIADATETSERPVFAAFPSCVPMIRDRGFDCLPLVQKSGDHPQPYANDVLTYLRLGRLLGRADRLVFDGGYVFDSIFRTVLERGTRAIWIRRGLWPEGDASKEALDRERIFERVIVPSEAFPELNDVYSQTPRVRNVGPILRQREQTEEECAALRARVAAHLGQPFERLVVSMLGGGVASDRSAQLQAISGLLAGRTDTLHLVVVWPGALVDPALHAWPNTRVVQTYEALSLCLAADLVTSAAGYNSVHEVLYHAIPAILIPQSAPYLDDQTRRAEALASRGLAEMIEAGDLLRLSSVLTECLEGGGACRLRASLAGADLPAPGAAEAARLIAEVGEEN
ncbi:Glycosyltransferase family 28 C-terminal domain-containing protein [Rhodovulum sp. ES.010]|uniref:glycosyltransferase n=1 Tax=Rhodovulum sp. ES.010 TaxID=1882821 RepID=UPI00092BA6B4|nr:glycosyltransferase [Rhodovulum sp. ES.010]SIO57180.1 Glycosyltransferase family 28 C-terminal domain-containing protein [Rhodovulum sp. ES.010]